MLTMLDPNEIRLSVLHGQKPDNCQVFRGSASGGRRFALKYALFYIISYTVLFSAIATWMQYFHLASGLNIEPLILDIMLFLLMGIVVFCIASSTAKNSAIVLFPEGWIAFNDIQYNLPKMQKFISYASLTDIQLNYNFLVGPYLVLRYHEGKAHKWSPNNYLARSTKMMILQSILVDYVTYKRSFKECF
jgi:hypothetical protein